LLGWYDSVDRLRVGGVLRGLQQAGSVVNFMKACYPGEERPLRHFPELTQRLTAGVMTLVRRGVPYLEAARVSDHAVQAWLEPLYAAGPRALIRAMADVQSQVTSNPSSIGQWAAVEALAGPQDEVLKMAGEFEQRRRVMIAGLNALPGLSCVTPGGAFYAFPNVSGLFGRGWQGRPPAGSMDVTAFLLEAARVAVVPGLDFGSDAHVRLSYATSDELIREGPARMDGAIRKLA
jgi:hypothetical protein